MGCPPANHECCDKCGSLLNASKQDKNLVKLNVGGRRFLTSRQTITQHDNSMLAAMFREDSSFRRVEDESGYCFLDRDGERFPHVLNYLRCGSLPNFNEVWRYETIMEEADFFAIQELKELCAQKMEELTAQQQAEKAKMMACTVTILESSSSSSSSSAAAAGSSFQPAAERRGLGTFTFTLDEDF